MRKLDFDKIKFSDEHPSTEESLKDIEPLLPNIWDIGRRLRLIADERGKTAYDIAVLIECDIDKVEDVFIGKRIMRYDHVVQVCELLGVMPEELLEEMKDECLEINGVAKQICNELGIAWDENATEATLNGKPVDALDIVRAFNYDCKRIN